MKDYGKDLFVHVFIYYLLCIRHCSGCWEYLFIQDRESSFSHGLHILAGKDRWYWIKGVIVVVMRNATLGKAAMTNLAEMMKFKLRLWHLRHDLNVKEPTVQWSEGNVYQYEGTTSEKFKIRTDPSQTVRETNICGWSPHLFDQLAGNFMKMKYNQIRI